MVPDFDGLVAFLFFGGAVGAFICFFTLKLFGVL